MIWASDKYNMKSQITQLSIERSESQRHAMSRRSVQWFRAKIKDMTNPRQLAVDIMGERWRKLNEPPEIGKLYHFSYNPKGRNELPYYDVFPLILMLQRTGDGFIGLNLHYLPITYRAAFMNKLLPYADRLNKQEIERVRITYPILKGAGSLREFKPCIKRYLHSHIRSKVMTIEPHEWEAALFLPTAQFKKATDKEVWKESVDNINGKEDSIPTNINENE